MTEADFYEELAGGAQHLTRARRKALRMCLDCWDESFASLPPDVRALALRGAIHQEYGFAIITFVLITVIAAAISWAIERFLDWRFPKNGVEIPYRIKAIAALKRAIE